ncbi:putative membrane protein At3g27390 [Tupanvirus deep ocean]|uniref:Membrane protein At3g27390 n=2 Tax=Tupanvirus TaxID=2094720 RepID=A0AC62A7F0_9VIRU|nr:putative membrane protein At3g27390 [Tupanvirus deep ocean]QKU33715.1 putative membrane protein At3g27390 [Tupanvirus deep ocean]
MANDSCCCFCGLLPLILMIHGVIIAVPAAIMSLIGALVVAIIWMVPDIIYTFWSIWLTPRWGTNVKFMVTLVTPIVVVAWLPLVALLSLIGGFVYGLFGPLIHGFTAFCGSNSDCGFLLCGGYGLRVFKNIADGLHDFWNLNHSYKAMLRDFRLIANADGSVYDISIIKIPIGLLLAIIASTFNTISLILMSVIFWIPITATMFKEFYGAVCCCGNNNFWGGPNSCTQSDKECCRCVSFVCFVPILCTSLLIPLVGPLMVILSPFYGIWAAVKAALYACNNNKFILSYYYTKEFIVSCLYTLIGFITDHNIHYDTPHLKGEGISVPSNPVYQHEVVTAPIVNVNDGAYDSYQDLSRCSPVLPEISIVDIWDNFFKTCTEYTREAITERLVNGTDIEDMEPYLFIGLPSFVVFRLVKRSLTHNTTVFVMSNGIIVAEENRPKNFLANSIWPVLVDLRKQLSNLKPDHNEIKYMEILLITMNDENKMPKFPEIPKERLRQINEVASKFQSLGITISRLPQVPRRLGDSLVAATNINV